MVGRVASRACASPIPKLRLGNLAGLLPFRRAQDLARWADAPSRSATPPEISGIAWEVTFVLRAERGRPASRRRGTSKPGASLAPVH